MATGEDWSTLLEFIQSEVKDTTDLMDKDGQYWTTPGIDFYEFKMRGGGSRRQNGEYVYEKERASFWNGSTDNNESESDKKAYLYFTSDGMVTTDSVHVGTGHSVRCIRTY